MPLLKILLVLVVAGVLLWLVNSYIPMQPTIKKILNVTVIVIIIIWLLKISGLFQSLQGVHI